MTDDGSFRCLSEGIAPNIERFSDDKCTKALHLEPKWTCTVPKYTRRFESKTPGGSFATVFTVGASYTGPQ